MWYSTARSGSPQDALHLHYSIIHNYVSPSNVELTYIVNRIVKEYLINTDVQYLYSYHHQCIKHCKPKIGVSLSTATQGKVAGNLKKYKCEKNGKEYAGIRMVRNTNLKMILYPCSHTTFCRKCNNVHMHGCCFRKSHTTGNEANALVSR